MSSRRMPPPVRLALNMARKSQCSGFKVGACLARGKSIFSVGVNQVKSHPMAYRRKQARVKGSWRYGLHAEVHACLGLDTSQLQGASIYVVRVKKDGTLGMAKPCIRCQEFLRAVGVKRAYYSTNDGEIEVLKLNKGG